MLNEIQIDNLIEPIIDRQESVNNFIINKIAQRMKEVGKLDKNDLKKLEQLAKTTAEFQTISKQLTNEFKKQQKMIEDLIVAAAKDAYVDAKDFYKTAIEFERNAELQRTISAIANQTGQTFKNLSNTKAIGFLVQDTKSGKLVFKDLEQTYKSTIDSAIQSVKLGTENYDQAVKRAIEQLSASGLRRIAWESGYTKRLDASVRQAIHDGLKALQLEEQKIIAKQIGADGWQLSAHPNSAPDHEPIQGHSFTLEEFDRMQNNEDFEDTWGNKFLALERVIGQWNCRHWARAIIIGKATGYKPETLKRWIDNNAKGYTMKNGKHLSLYECSQYMRKLEERIRDEKVAQIAAETAEQEQLAKEHRDRVMKYINQYKAFSKACGLAVKKNRITVSEYKKLH